MPPNAPGGPARLAGSQERPRLSRAGLPLRVGVGGPVGSGKTSLLAALCRALFPQRSVAAITNDIYTSEDARILKQAAVLPEGRIRAVETGCCPHTAIRDDIAANLEAAERLEAEFPDLELLLIESGGDNLTATFSYGLVDLQVFVIDVAGGDKTPRKGGPGITNSDLLVINKADLAGYVGADLEVMAQDASACRRGSPFVMLSLVEDPLARPVASWLAGQMP